MAMGRYTIEEMIAFGQLCVKTNINHTPKSIGKVLEVFNHSKNVVLTNEETHVIKLLCYDKTTKAL